MEEIKYLPLYYKWMESGYIDSRGLCDYFGRDGLFLLIGNGDQHGYWGARQSPEYKSEMSTYDYVSKFTTLRQTVVLLMAAMNDEL